MCFGTDEPDFEVSCCIDFQDRNCRSYISKLKAGSCYKTLVAALQTTRRHVSEDRYLNTHGRGAHKLQNQPSVKNEKTIIF